MVWDRAKEINTKKDQDGLTKRNERNSNKEI